MLTLSTDQKILPRFFSIMTDLKKGKTIILDYFAFFMYLFMFCHYLFSVNLSFFIHLLSNPLNHSWLSESSLSG